MCGGRCHLSWHFIVRWGRGTSLALRAGKAEKARSVRGERMNRTRMSAALAGLVGLIAFWGLAILVALDDIDFFSSEDFRDTSGLHHEHIVLGLALLGLVAFVLPHIVLSQRRV